MTSNRVVALGAAVVFGVVGVWGLIVSVATADAPQVEARLAWEFGTSLPLAALHLLLAAALVFGFLGGDARARIVNTTAGCVLFALGMFGLFAVGAPFNVLGLTGASNLLHFAASATLLAAGIGAAPVTGSEDRRSASHR